MMKTVLTLMFCLFAAAAFAQADRTAQKAANAGSTGKSESPANGNVTTVKQSAD